MARTMTLPHPTGGPHIGVPRRQSEVTALQVLRSRAFTHRTIVMCLPVTMGHDLRRASVLTAR